MAVYIPVGHGSEDLTKPRKEVPEGCSVTVIETCGGAHYWNTKGNETFEYIQLTVFLQKHTDKRYIFSNPKENSHILNDIFGSVAIYGPGEKYPNIRYSLLLSWPTKIDISHDVRYSGLIPFDTFVSPNFTTVNIVKKLLTESNTPADPEKNIYPYLNYDYKYNDIWLANNKEIYKHSVYPSPEDYMNYFGNLEARRELFKDAKRLGMATREIDDIDDIADWDYAAKQTFSGKMITKPVNEGYINVSLEYLMAKFPGHYIHIVCRSTNETLLPWGANPNPDIEHTQEELFIKRIPYMSNNQKRQGIINIEKSRNAKQKSKFNVHSTRSVNNVMLAGLKKSLAQKELLSTVKRQNGGRYTRKIKRGVFKLQKSYKNPAGI